MPEDIDLSGMIEKIQDMFSTDEGKSQIENIVSMLGSNESNSVSNSPSFDNVEMAMKLSSVMSAMNSAESTKQVCFLKSLAPLLKPDKQNKVDSAIKFLSMSKALKALKNI